MIQNYPFILEPAYKHYLWGGCRIVETFNRSVAEERTAESWEASVREDGMSFISNGPLKGKSLKETFLEFPLLIKLIDAQKSLSIQVHPNDQNASLFGGEAKSEMWHVLHAEEGAQIYLGLKSRLSDPEIREAIESNCLETHMHHVSVKEGQTFYIPGGLLHSIGKGCLIYEVQQNSDTTYRLYDWGRVDHEGNSRPLHIDKALKVMLQDQKIPIAQEPQTIYASEGVTHSRLLSCPYFNFFKWEASSPVRLDPSSVFRAFFVLKGNLFLESSSFNDVVSQGQTFIVPPKYELLTLSSKEGPMVLLETTPNHF